MAIKVSDLARISTTVAADPEPKLSGDLDTNNQSIINTAGPVNISGLNYPDADGLADQAIITDGAGNLTFGDVLQQGDIIGDRGITVTNNPDGTVTLVNESAGSTKDGYEFSEVVQESDPGSGRITANAALNKDVTQINASKVNDEGDEATELLLRADLDDFIALSQPDRIVFFKVTAPAVDEGTWIRFTVVHEIGYPDEGFIDGIETLLRWFPRESVFSVNSVFGRSGDVIAEAADYAAFYATAAQGALADTALQDITGESIADLIDVSLLAMPNVGQILKWDGRFFVAADETSSGGDVSSVFGRTGDVVSAFADYTTDDIVNQSSATGVTLTEALESLNTGGGGIPEAPGPEQYTRTNTGWSELGTVNITLGDNVNIGTLDNPLLSHDKSAADDPLFPDTTFLTLGAPGTGLNVDSVLFDPLVIKNDTAIQGYKSDYASVANLISISADDKITIGDGGLNETVIRSENAFSDPKVRQGTFGDTIDYKIWHTGDNLSNTVDLGNNDIDAYPAFPTYKKGMAAPLGETGWYYRNTDENPGTGDDRIQWRLFNTRGTDEVTWLITDSIYIVIDVQNNSAENLSFPYINLYLHDPDAPPLTPLKSVNYEVFGDSPTRLEDGKMILYVGKPPKSLGELPMYELELNTSVSDPPLLTDIIDYILVGTNNSASTGGPVPDDSVQFVISQFGIEFGGYERVVNLVINDSLPDHIADADPHPQYLTDAPLDGQIYGRQDAGWVVTGGGIPEAPGPEQYTITNTGWSELGTVNITLGDSVNIGTLENPLLSHDKSAADDPLFPDTTFVTLGAPSTGLNIDSVLFDPLRIKNDTAIQGYKSDYSEVANLVSMSSDDKITIGDGGLNETVIRSENAFSDPKVRQGTFGDTTDYKIWHTGDNLSNTVDIGNNDIDAYPAFPTYKKGIAAPLGETGWYYRNTDENPGTGDDRIQWRLFNTRGTDEVTWLVTDSIYVVIDIQNNSAENLSFPYINLYLHDPDDPPLTPLKSVNYEVFGDSPTRLEDGKMILYVGRPPKSLGELPMYELELNTSVSDPPLLTDIIDYILVGTNNSASTGGPVPDDSVQFVISQFGIEFGGYERAVNLVINDSLPDHIADADPHPQYLQKGDLSFDSGIFRNRDATVYADHRIAKFDPTGNAGWYYRNDNNNEDSIAGDGTDKINWYFFTDDRLPSETDFDLGNYESTYAVIDIRKASSNPYFVLYTKPEGDGQDGAAWYRSRITYDIGWGAESGRLVVYAGEDPGIFPELQRVQLTTDGLSDVGPQAPDEKVKYFNISTSSGVSDDTEEFNVEQVGFKYAGYIREYNLICQDNAQAQIDLHVLDSNPHEQYITRDDLPTVIEGWFNNALNPLDNTFLTMGARTDEAESSITVTTAGQGVDVQFGQWLGENVSGNDFIWVDSPVISQLDLECTGSNVEVVMEFYRLSSSVETLVAQSAPAELEAGRQTYTLISIIVGPTEILTGDNLICRIKARRDDTGSESNVTLWMEGIVNPISHAVLNVPVATYPALHADSHYAGNSDPIDHDLLLNATGQKSHSQIDTDITNLQNTTASQSASINVLEVTVNSTNVISGRYEPNTPVNTAQFIPILGPFTPTSTGTVHLHWQFAGGTQLVVSLIWSAQFSNGELVKQVQSGTASIIDSVRIRKSDDDGGLYVGFVTSNTNVVEAINATATYTQQGNQVPIMNNQTTGINGTDLATVNIT